MKNILAALVLAVAGAASARAEGKLQLGQVASGSNGIAAASSPEDLQAAGAKPWGQTPQAPAVYVDAQYAAATANIPEVKGAEVKSADVKKDVKPGGPPAPGILDKAGSTLKEYTPHLLTAGIGGAAGALVAKVGGFGLLGSIAAGAGIGLAAMYLYKKGETGAAIGAA
ncbi:MAG: hypothetical protein FD126_2601, partial [Elusimicrobia bacterium]